MSDTRRVVLIVVTLCIVWAGVVSAAGECLVVLTHGSRWLYGDSVWRYPAFKSHEASFELLTTTPLSQVLASFPEQALETHVGAQLTFELDQAVDDALLFHLTGATPGYDGLRAAFTVTDPIGGVYHYSNHISDRTLHIDQPVQGTYTIDL